MLKSILFMLIAVCFWASQSMADFRIWSSQDGASNTEAQFIQMSGDKVVLEKRDGSRIMVPMNRLCTKDQEHLASIVPPALKFVVKKGSSNENLYEYAYSTKVRETTTIAVEIKKTSKAPCTQKLKAYLFVVAKSYKGSSRALIAKKDVSFSFDKQDSVSIQASGSVVYRDSYGGGKTGWDYEGYVVLVEDENGQVIAVDPNKSVYESKLSVIRKSGLSNLDSEASDYKVNPFGL